jgi:ribosome biogenesis protein Tsr3
VTFYEIIIDSGETANKCTIAPLASRPDFRLLSAKGAEPIGPLKSSVLLHPQGECLTKIRSCRENLGIAAIDCVWRRVDPILSRIAAPVPVLGRIPDGFQTAYLRKSYYGYDPDGGLATIEAIFAARALLGHWQPDLLSKYPFGRRFVELNQRRFLELGVVQASDLDAMPVFSPPPKNSLQRRRDRTFRF